MLKKADKIKKFAYCREYAQNPNTGFMSFQHFKGEKLYGDIVVKKENNMTETETVECYPVSADAIEVERDLYYYPEESVAYFRVLWKEWEPQQGKYNVDFVRGIIDRTKAHGQTLFFRLMPHSTRSCDDVPDWLKSLIDCPERPDGKRVKDSPTDPLFVKLFGEAVRALGRYFDSDPIFSNIDISLPGAWGEGFKLELYPKEDLESLFNCYIESFPNTRLMAQLWRPDLVRYVNQKQKVGIRGDGYGESHHIHEMYPPAIEELSDVWESAPLSLETFWWIGEWHRQNWDIDEIIDLSLKWHVSSVNGKSMPVPLEWKEKIENWISKMGYHFVIDSFGCPESAKAGDSLELVLSVDNVGVAPIYDKTPLIVTLIGDNEYTFKTDIDITKWLPGKHCEEICISLPETIATGTYRVAVAIGDDDCLPVYFATNAPRADRKYIVGEIFVG